MFDSIRDWIIDNKDSLISNILIGSLFLGLGRLWILKNHIPKVVKRFKNVKIIKFLGFIIMYLLPLGAIVLMIVVKTNDLTFTNIALFILICITLIFNILMTHINSIYTNITDLAKMNNKSLDQIDKNFESIYSAILEIKKKTDK